MFGEYDAVDQGAQGLLGCEANIETESEGCNYKLKRLHLRLQADNEVYVRVNTSKLGLERLQYAQTFVRVMHLLRRAVEQR